MWDKPITFPICCCPHLAWMSFLDTQGGCLPTQSSTRYCSMTTALKMTSRQIHWKSYIAMHLWHITIHSFLKVTLYFNYTHPFSHLSPSIPYSHFMVSLYSVCFSQLLVYKDSEQNSLWDASWMICGVDHRALKKSGRGVGGLVSHNDLRWKHIDTYLYSLTKYFYIYSFSWC